MKFSPEAPSLLDEVNSVDPLVYPVGIAKVGSGDEPLRYFPFMVDDPMPPVGFGEVADDALGTYRMYYPSETEADLDRVLDSLLDLDC
jgi:hypothetical protein